MDEKTIEFNKSEFIKKLEQLRELEIQKAVKDIDTDFIDTIVLLGLELKGLKTELTPEEVEEKVRKIPFVEKTTTLNTPPTSVKGRATKVKSHKILLIAAIISILVAIFTISSIAFNWNIFDELKNRFGTVANVPVNEEIDVGGFSVYMYGKNKDYKSLDDALDALSLEFLYPSELPGNIKLEKILLSKIESVDTLIFIFDDIDLSYSITFNMSISDTVRNGATEIMCINNKEIFVTEMSDVGLLQVQFEYENNLYYLSYDNKQGLIEVIENLKELQ